MNTKLHHYAAAAAALLATSAWGAEIQTGNPDLSLRWDTTLKYSVAARVKSADAIYLGADNANGDDGDRNFGKGLTSNRLDLFTEADLIWQHDFGLRLSGAAYYDDVYHHRTDNPGFPGGAFPNHTPADRFAGDTRDVMGRKAELLDAFVFGKFNLGETSASVRAGRHAITWGESLFFGSNAIAGAMMPVDAIKLSSVPATQFKEAIRPVPMLSGVLQLTPSVAVSAYYQFRWEETLIPPAGSYLSTADMLGEGGDRLLLGPAGAAVRLADRKPKDSGQGGLQLRFRGEDTDYALYAVRYHEKAPQLVPVLALVPGVGPLPASYYLAYQEGVTGYAASASRSFGLFNVAVEAGIRRNASLASTQGADASALAPPGVIPATNNTNNPGYAVGNTAHVNLSTLATLDDSFLWREATLTAEVAWNRVTVITRNAAAADPNSTREGWAGRVVLEPTYRGVFPGVDIGVPVGLGWAPKGSRPLAAGPSWIPENGGDISLGLNASFRDVWRFTLNYNHYYGSAATGTRNGIYTYKQALADRDFIAASVRYSF